MRRLPAALSATLLLVLAVAGCSSSGSPGSAAPAAAGVPTATAAQGPVAGATLDASAFAAALEVPGTVVLDVRTPEEFAAGHLPGAVNLDVQAPGFAAAVAALDPTVPYAVYCRSGNRSQVALDLMAESGVRGAYHLAGGIGAWQAAGGEVVTG
jgi:phage shock protein E